MRGRVVAFVLCAACLVAACGGSSTKDSQTSGGKKYVDALVANYNKGKASGATSVQYTDKQIRCLSSSIVDAITVDTLQKNGITPAKAGGGVGIDKLGKKLSQATRTKLGKAFLDGSCYDATTELAKEFQASMGTQPAGAAKCMAKEVIAIPAFQQFIGDTTVGINAGTPFQGSVKKALQPAFTKCHVDQSKIGA